MDRPLLAPHPRLESPEGPTWTDALAVLSAAGFDVQVEREDEPASLPETDDDQLRFLRRVMPVGQDHDEALPHGDATMPGRLGAT